MSVDFDTIHKALRNLPEFDGNPNVLPRFIQLCDRLVSDFVKYEPGNELNNLTLLNGILNKVTGHAARLINSNGIPVNWSGIRNALTNNFADQRNETALYNDIALQTQGNSTPQEFYDRCQTLFSTMMTYITLHESLQTTVEAKRDLYKKLTLQAFVRGLKEPIGSRIRCMRPTSIEQALEYVQEEINTMYIQSRNDALPKSHALTNHRSMPSNSVISPVQLPTFPRNVHNNQFNKPPINVVQHNAPPTPFRLFNNRPQFQMPSRTQQMFRAQPPNYNPHSNVFRMPPRNPPQALSTPKPMSGVSHFVPRTLPPSGHDWRRFGNPPPSNYFKTRDVNLNECAIYADDYNYYYPENYEDYYYADNYDYAEIPNDYANYSESVDIPCNIQEITDHHEPGPSSRKPEDFQKSTLSKKPT